MVQLIGQDQKPGEYLFLKDLEYIHYDPVIQWSL